MKKWIGALLTIVSMGILISIGNATQLNFNSINMGALSGNFSNVFFNGGGNNFGWGIFWFNSKAVSGSIPIAITRNWSNVDSKTCSKLLRGIYYNGQRGNRIRPLDSYTLDLIKGTNTNYGTLSISGWLYTDCVWADNKYSIFGVVRYNRSGTITYIIAGTKFTYNTNLWSGEFAQSFQFFDNKTPLGYIRDSVGGIGFVGGNLIGSSNLITFLNGGGNINSWFIYAWQNSNIITGASRWSWVYSQVGNSAISTMRNLIVQGTIWLSNSMSLDDKASLVGNQEGNSTIFNTSITNADIVNQAKQNAEKLCKGKRQTINNWATRLSATNTGGNVLCYLMDNSTVANSYLEISIDSTNQSSFANKTIVAKNGDVALVGNMSDSSPALDILIDKWNLYIPNTTNISSLIGFDTQWFPNNSSPVNKGLFIKGNIIINGLLIGGQPNNPWSVTNKTHIQGKFFSLNTPFEPTTQRATQVQELLSGAPNQYDNYINLQKIFTRECIFGTGTDNTSCQYGNDISRVPLVILDRLFPSRLLK